MRVTDPTAFVAEAFEESYDTVNMRAKGFIYVSPISGPLRPKNINRQSSLSNIWSDENGMRFATVIAHELGHVFGFCHQNDWLMRENRPQLVVEHGLPSPFGGNLAYDRDILLKKIQATVGSAHLGTAAVLSTDLYAGTENKEVFLLKNEDGLANFVDQNSAIAAVRSRIGTFVMYRKQTDGSLIKVGELTISDFSFGQPTSTQPLKFPTEQTVFKGYLQDSRLNGDVDALNAFDLPIAWVSGVLRSTENLPDVSMRVDLYTNEDLRVFVVKNNQLVRISE